jgi:PAS domain S-box-containing protein
MRPDKRKSGISLIGELPWGSRFCQFYQTTGDLLEILIPYFEAGLENNEFCLWVTAEMPDDEAWKGDLDNALSHFEPYIRQGRMEIISSSRWHGLWGNPGSAVVSTLDRAMSRGFDGLRLFSSVFPAIGEGEEACPFHEVGDIRRYNVLALLAYPREDFDASGIMEVLKNHRLALVRTAGRWEMIESSEAGAAKDDLTRSEEKLQFLFRNMSEGFAYHRILLDAGGQPCDYIFLEINHAFEKLTGLTAKEVIGQRATEVLPGLEKDPADWIGRYGKVALTGNPVRFESYSESLKKWFSISAFSPHKGFFAVTFSEVTGRKQAEEEIKQLNKELRGRVAELSAVNASLRDSRHAALNLMEDAIAARNQAESTSEDLRREISERKRAEEMVKSTALFPEENPFPVLRVDGDGTLLYANRTAAELLPEWQCMVGGEVPDFLRRELAAALDSGTNRETEILCGERDFSFEVVPIAERDYVNLYGRDVTAAKKAGEELRQSESFYRQMLESIPGMVFTTRPDGYCDYQSQQWVDYTGVPMEEHLGDGWNRLLHPDDRPRAFATWCAAVDGRARYDLEYRVRRHDGAYEWFKVIGRPIHDEAGEIVRWFGVAMNIEELKLAEEARRESEERLRLFIEHAPAALAMFDREMRYLNVSQRWRDDFDLGDREVLGHCHYKIFPEIGEMWRDAHQRGLTGQVLGAEADRFLRADGSVQWVRWEIRPWYDSAGEVGGIVIFAEDITDEKSAEAKIQRQNQLLTGINRMFQVALTSLSEEELGETCLAAALEITGSRFGFIGEIGPDGMMHDIAISDTGWEACAIYNRQGERRLPGDFHIHGIYGRVLLDGKGFFINDPSSHSGSIGTPEGHPALTAFLGVPLLREGRVIGMVAVGNREGGYDREDQETLEALAPAIVEAFLRKRAEKERIYANQRLDLLAMTAGRLLATASPQQVIHELCDRVMEFLDCQVFFNFLVNEEGGRLHLNAFSGISEEVAKDLEWLDYGRGVCGCAARDACRIVVENIPETPDPRTDLVKSFGIRAYACHPLMTWGRVLGTLSFGTRTRNRFTDDELALMKAVADQVAIAMERKWTEEALQSAHGYLEVKVEERTTELREKDRMLLQQSRQAAMGEMINNIAHQWRQPLNGLGLIIQSLPMMYASEGFSRKYLEEMGDKAMGIIHHMSQTIDDFRNYFKPDKEKVRFHVHQPISRTINLIEESFRNLDIHIEVDAKDDPVICGYPNEFAQVLLNILINARDAFLERQVREPKISIILGTRNEKAIVTIADNAGGIPENVITKIFEPYFTTKGPDKGTGIGLFMSKTIIENNMGGRLFARNTAGGAEFRIEV